MTTDTGQPPQWAVTAHGYPPVPPSYEPAWRGGHDWAACGVTAVFVALSGPVLGLVWSQLAPKLSIAGVVAGSESPFRAQIGADAWFLLLSAVAGIVCAAVALALRGRGPGVVVGLALGGSAAAVIADRVGYLAQRAHTLSALQAFHVNAHGDVLGIVDFRVRAVGVVVAWPLAAVLVYALALVVRGRTRSLP